MDVGNIKGNMRLLLIFILDELAVNGRFIQKREFMLPYGNPLRSAGAGIEGIIIAKAMLVQQLVHHLATVAAELFSFGAGLAAMGALGNGSGCLHAPKVSPRPLAADEARHGEK